MNNFRLGAIESRFADIVWQNAPLSTKTLVELCQQELNWKRTTTYTVLKKFCQRDIFCMENGAVSVRMDKAEFSALQSQQFVEETFRGSLPAFLAAFGSRKKPSREELAQIRALLDSFEEA